MSETTAIATSYIPAAERVEYNTFWDLGDNVAVYVQSVAGDRFWYNTWNRQNLTPVEDPFARFLSEMQSRVLDLLPEGETLPYTRVVDGEDRGTVPAFPAPDVDWATAAETETVVLGTRTGEEIITDPLDPRVVHFFVAAAEAADRAGYCPTYDAIAADSNLPTRADLRRAGAMPMVRVTVPVEQTITETRTRTLYGTATVELAEGHDVTNNARAYIDTTPDDDIDVVWNDEDDNGEGWQPDDVETGHIANDYTYGRYVERVRD